MTFLMISPTLHQLWGDGRPPSLKISCTLDCKQVLKNKDNNVTWWGKTFSCFSAVLPPHTLNHCSCFCLFLSFILWILLYPAPDSGFTSTPFHSHPTSSSSTQKEPLALHPHQTAPRTRFQGSGRVGFSLAKVHQELQMLQRQLRDHESVLVYSTCMSFTTCELTCFNLKCTLQLIRWKRFNNTNSGNLWKIAWTFIPHFHTEESDEQLEQILSSAS